MQQAAYQDKPVQRADIQALRGYAVLLVLVYHAGLGIAEGGYLGVDVFFVISGYLITKLIKERIEANKFTFREFYFRRAKRLLPAAYVTYLVTAIAAPYFLTPQSFVDFMWQLTGALTFSANIVLWKQTGYFESASELKPLLHIWSLAIEEQYYLLLPPVMVMLPKRWWVPCASIVVVGSLVLCWFSVGWKPSATFYLLPTRGWELAIGSVGALWKIPDHFAKVLTRIFWPAVALVCIIPFALIGTYHPGIDALIVCIATLVIVLANNETAAASAIVRLFAVFGNFSYSLYLVHWPIFAFASNAYLREVPWEARLLCFSVSLIFGYLLYRLIEKPFRQVEVSDLRKGTTIAVVTSLGLLAVAWIVPQTNDLSKNFAYLMRPNFGLSEECEYKGPFKPKIQCQNSQEPKILVWGDSYAMHLVAGIVASTDLGVVQATRSVCGPILDLAPVNDLTETPTWGEDCIVFNRDVLQYLSQSKSIDTVVLASPFWTYLPPEIGAKQWRNLRLTNGRHTVDDPDPERVKLALKETVEQIRGLGKKVIIVAPPPSAGFDIAECLEREAVGQVVLGVHASCKINVTDYHQHKLNTLKFLAAVRKEMPMIGFDDFLCHNSLCVTKIDETLVYRDNGHLSYEGSRLLGRRMDLAGQILLKAN